MTTFLGTKADTMMAPLVEAIANIEGATVISNDNGSDGSPFVFFKAPQIFASTLSVPLVAMHTTIAKRPLNYFWNIEGRFREGGELCWHLSSPSLDNLNSTLSKRISHFLHRKKLEADLEVLTKMVNQIAHKLPDIHSGSLLNVVHKIKTYTEAEQNHNNSQPHGGFNRTRRITFRAWTLCIARNFIPTNTARHHFRHYKLLKNINGPDTVTHKGFLGILSPRMSIFAAVLLLSACATGPGTEIQEDPDGFDAPRKSPCACDPVPYRFKPYVWKDRDFG